MKIKISVEQPIPYAGKEAIAELALSLDAPDEDVIFAVNKLRDECGKLVDREMEKLGIELDEEGFRKKVLPDRCNKKLRKDGQSYPRTCQLCKLGPCPHSA